MSLDRFADWKARADERDLHETALKYGAVLKRAGREWVGPCPECGGKDRFSVNQGKHKWHCRGHGGGHGAISMVAHIAGLSFIEACEALTGEPNPSGERARPLTEAEKAERNRQRLANEARAAARAAEEAAHREDTREAAAALWAASLPVAGTLAQGYLERRGIRLDEWPDVLRFHPALAYPGLRDRLPVLICRVDDVCGELTAVWRIYLGADGRKAAVPADPGAKLGLGPAARGAVRIGGFGRKVAIAEGVESALGYWLMTGRKIPAWAALSTAGMVGFEVPLGVEHVVIAPDGDAPMKRDHGDFVPALPAGRRAAHALHARLMTEHIGCTIAAEPPAGQDYNDLWNDLQRESVA